MITKVILRVEREIDERVKGLFSLWVVVKYAYYI